MIDSHRSRYAGYATRELTVEGNGPKFLLLHGFGHPSDCWRPVLQRLAKAGRSAVAVDLPGFGQADDARRGRKLPQLDAFVADVINQHGSHEPVTVMGNSLGGLMAVRAAAAGLPVRAALPLCAAGFGWTPAIRVGAAGNLRPLVALAGVPVPARVRRQAANTIGGLLMYGDRKQADRAMVDLLTAQLGDPASTRRLMRAAIAYAAEVSTHQRIGTVSCPVTVIHGRRDRIVSLDASKRLRDQLPGSTLVVLPRAGHCPQLDAPDDVTRLAIRLADSTLQQRNSG
ncbi:alpha/beta hydrolase [Candidatus Mycobacterium wuenschmannii]|uniref:Alpha/beta hydrolase n=1 Tax=Candidatus Mycobacterium wuenschmannii TaxID=3027808 RepID=A0ABY8VT30_9MYCO|nr:alpha/beta hydrolase [Candidatus Mycobacterium wuenschmannii]WIM86780.1 alpha/beta hydrolase [Candidatus Mycobacterium wuenschmannii]